MVNHFGATTFYELPKEFCEEAVEKYFGLDSLKDLSILDAGCRLGEYSRTFYEHQGLPTGVDIDKACLEYAKKQDHGTEIPYRCADLQDLSQFEDQQFDLVFCVGTMPYIPPKKQSSVIKELQRVTKADGKILLVYQKNKSLFFKFIVSCINLLPLEFYRLLASLACVFLRPIAQWMIGRKISKGYFKYAILMSLRGLHFGYPNFLDPFKIVTPDCSSISQAMNESFIIRPEDNIDSNRA